MSEFDGIEGFTGWNSKLNDLLHDAMEAAQQEALPPRLAIVNRLTTFMEQSRPNTPDILALDQIATDTANALLRTTIEERLASIAERQADLIQFTKKLQTSTEAARESAASIRFERITKVVNVLTTAVGELQNLKTVLDDGSNAQLVASIERLVTAIQRVRAEVERTI
jgi:hypothetical protein